MLSGGREVVIGRYAGEAVLKGAHVYAPGLLAASRGLAAGDLVGVSVAVERPGRWSMQAGRQAGSQTMGGFVRPGMHAFPGLAV